MRFEVTIRVTVRGRPTCFADVQMPEEAVPAAESVAADDVDQDEGQDGRFRHKFVDVHGVS